MMSLGGGSGGRDVFFMGGGIGSLEGLGVSLIGDGASDGIKAGRLGSSGGGVVTIGGSDDALELIIGGGGTFLLDIGGGGAFSGADSSCFRLKMFRAGLVPPDVGVIGGGVGGVSIILDGGRGGFGGLC